MKSYKAVLFDFDYTLADSSEGIIAAVNFALEQLALPTADERTIRKLIGRPLDQILAHFTTNRSLLADFTKHFQQKADQVMVANTHLFYEVYDLLALLQSLGVKLGIVSTKRRETMTKVLEKVNLLQAFDVIVGGEDVRRHKPSPDALIKAMKKLRSNGKSTLYVGDSVVDAQAAQRIKVDFIGVLTGQTTKATLEKYNHLEIVQDLKALQAYFGILV